MDASGSEGGSEDDENEDEGAAPSSMTSPVMLVFLKIYYFCWGECLLKNHHTTINMVLHFPTSADDRTPPYSVLLDIVCCIYFL